MKIVAHHIDKVQVFVHVRHIVRDVNSGLPRTDGCGQQKLVLAKRFLQLFGEEDEVLLIICGPAPLAGILPVQVQAVKIVLCQELNCAIHELGPLLPALGHLTVLGAALVPASDGDHHLEVGPGVAQLRGLFEAREDVDLRPL